MIAVKRRLKKWTPIGVDFGASAICAIQLRREGRLLIVSGAARQELRERGAAVAQSAAAAAQLAICLKAAKFKGRLAIAGISAPDVEFHPLDAAAAAAAADDQPDPGVQAELERLTTDIDGPLETRFWPISAGAQAPTAIGVAVAQSLAVNAAQSCEGAGLSCARVGPVATALADFTHQLRDWSPDEIVGVLDVGLRQSRLVLCVQRQPVLVRQAGSGGHAWTERIAVGLNVSERTAEVHKRDSGIAMVGQHRETGESRTELSSMVLGALRRDLTDLAGEIKRSYEYVMRCYPGKRAGELVLVGGGSRLRNLPEFLSDALGIDVQLPSAYLGDAACRLVAPANGVPPPEFCAAAIGLAMEG